MTYLAPKLYPVYSYLTGYVSRKLGIRSEFVMGRSYAQLQRGEADVSFVCGLPYVLISNMNPDLLEPIAAPVLKGERYQDRPIYYSDVIVRTVSPAKSFEDLGGVKWAYNETESQSGYGITLYTLVNMGKTEGFFGEVIKSGFHQKSIQMVVDGEVDASAIDSQLLEVELREQKGLGGKIKIIDTLGPSTIQPVVVNKNLDKSLQEDIQSILLEIEHDPAARRMLDFGLIKSFAAVDDSSYEDIRRMRAACERVGFTELR
jgi:phosphonate transport system substrate-binding protein